MTKQKKFDPRTVLRAATGAAAIGFAVLGVGPSFAESAGADPLSGERLYADVVKYSSFGDHRTATEADVNTSKWLAEELRKSGLEVELSPWTHQQFFINDHHLILNGTEIKSFPLWWPTSTGPEPIVAPLALFDEDGKRGALAGKIGVGSIPRERGSSIIAGNGIGDAVVSASRQGAKALLMVTESPTGEIVGLNAMAGLRQWPIPVLCVGQRDERRLRKAAMKGAEASFLLDGYLDYNATAYEVVGRLKRGKNHVVISTPSSGWFQCAGERGPGIALWLAIARWAADSDSDTSYTFVASSGHEMEAMGIRHFAGHGAPPPDEVGTWLHLGAGIATYDYEFGPDGAKKLNRPNPRRRLMTNQEKLMPLLEKNFGGMPGLRPILSETPGGEMILMAREGYEVWGFAGGSAYHHMPGDVPERITGPELLEPVARAVVRTIQESEAEWE